MTFPGKNTIIFIVGPTAVGKTSLAVKLARRIGGEIISCDSMQVYKGMGILSQAPAFSQRSGVKHHFVGMLSPGREYNVAFFRERSLLLIKSILRQGKIPVFAGGSGLYAKALIDGLFPSPGPDASFRKKMARLAARHGSVRLHDELSKIDPDAAARIHRNDLRRIIRALEVYRFTGKTITEMKAQTAGLSGAYNLKIFALTKPRETLYADINSRVDKMFRNGAVREVKKLRAGRSSKTARSALGFKEISGYLKGEYDLSTAAELTKMNTRRFAKRQLSWFRADKRIRWFDVSKIKEQEIMRAIIKECAL